MQGWIDHCWAEQEIKEYLARGQFVRTSQLHQAKHFSDNPAPSPTQSTSSVISPEGRGDSHMKRSGILIGNLNETSKGDQSGCGSSSI